MLIASIVVKKKFATIQFVQLYKNRPSVLLSVRLLLSSSCSYQKTAYRTHVRPSSSSVRISVVFFWSIECMSDTCLSVHLSVLLLWSIECMSATCSGFYFCFDGNRWRSHPLCTTDDTMRGRKRRRRTGWHWEGGLHGTIHPCEQSDM